MGVSVILPAYQEAENLRDILPRIRGALDLAGMESGDYEILVIDTAEPMDDTEAVCCRLGVKCIARQAGNSYGDAIRTGIKEANHERIVVMDADGSHNPEDILRLQAAAREKRLDVVIGSRYIPAGGSHNNFVLKLMSLMVNTAYRLAFNLNVRDVSNSFRLYSADMLKNISLECDNFDIVEEILIRLEVRYPNIRIGEIPIFFDRRVYGKSKRNLVKFIFSYLVTMWRLLKIKKQEQSGSSW